MAKCEKVGFDRLLAKLEDGIAKHGHSIIATAHEAENGKMVSLVYTVGLAGRGLPELVTFGLPPESAAAIFNEVINRLAAGTLETDVPLSELASLPVVMKMVAPAQADDVLVFASRREGRSIKALQLFWPDQGGHFPWKADFDPGLRLMQPMLYEHPSLEMVSALTSKPARPSPTLH